MTMILDSRYVCAALLFVFMIRPENMCTELERSNIERICPSLTLPTIKLLFFIRWIQIVCVAIDELFFAHRELVVVRLIFSLSSCQTAELLRCLITCSITHERENHRLSQSSSCIWALL